MPTKISENPIHLGLGATAVIESPITGGEWYAGYEKRRASDGNEARLVAEFSFRESWSMWEMHPNGSEIVICTAGEMTLVQEIDGESVRTTLRPGEYAINGPGVWHTADVEDGATALFITAGAGTQHRPR